MSKVVRVRVEPTSWMNHIYMKVSLLAGADKYKSLNSDETTALVDPVLGKPFSVYRTDEPTDDPQVIVTDGDGERELAVGELWEAPDTECGRGNYTMILPGGGLVVQGVDLYGGKSQDGKPGGLKAYVTKAKVITFSEGEEVEQELEFSSSYNKDQYCLRCLFRLKGDSPERKPINKIQIIPITCEEHIRMKVTVLTGTEPYACLTGRLQGHIFKMIRERKRRERDNRERRLMDKAQELDRQLLASEGQLGTWAEYAVICFLLFTVVDAICNLVFNGIMPVIWPSLCPSLQGECVGGRFESISNDLACSSGTGQCSDRQCASYYEKHVTSYLVALLFILNMVAIGAVFGYEHMFAKQLAPLQPTWKFWGVKIVVSAQFSLQCGLAAVGMLVTPLSDQDYYRWYVRCVALVELPALIVLHSLTAYRTEFDSNRGLLGMQQVSVNCAYDLAQKRRNEPEFADPQDYIRQHLGVELDKNKVVDVVNRRTQGSVAAFVQGVQKGFKLRSINNRFIDPVIPLYLNVRIDSKDLEHFQGQYRATKYHSCKGPVWMSRWKTDYIILRRCHVNKNFCWSMTRYGDCDRLKEMFKSGFHGTQIEFDPDSAWTELPSWKKGTEVRSRPFSRDAHSETNVMMPFQVSGWHKVDGETLLGHASVTISIAEVCLRCATTRDGVMKEPIQTGKVERLFLHGILHYGNEECSACKGRGVSEFTDAGEDGWTGVDGPKMEDFCEFVELYFYDPSNKEGTLSDESKTNACFAKSDAAMTEEITDILRDLDPDSAVSSKKQDQVKDKDKGEKEPVPESSGELNVVQYDPTLQLEKLRRRHANEETTTESIKRFGVKFFFILILAIIAAGSLSRWPAISEEGEGEPLVNLLACPPLESYVDNTTTNTRLRVFLDKMKGTSYVSSDKNGDVPRQLCDRVALECQFGYTKDPEGLNSIRIVCNRDDPCWHTGLVTPLLDLTEEKKVDSTLNQSGIVFEASRDVDTNQRVRPAPDSHEPLWVERVVAESAADKAGVISAMELVEVDGESVYWLSAAEKKHKFERGHDAQFQDRRVYAFCHTTGDYQILGRCLKCPCYANDEDCIASRSFGSYAELSQDHACQQWYLKNPDLALPPTPAFNESAECKMPKPPPHAYPGRNFGTFTRGGLPVPYACKPGYAGEPKAYCDADGTAYVNGSCEAVHGCDSTPPDIPHATLITDQGPWTEGTPSARRLLAAKEYAISTTLRYQCDRGYFGRPSATCLVDGTWEQTPDCKPIVSSSGCHCKESWTVCNWFGRECKVLNGCPNPREQAALGFMEGWCQVRENNCGSAYQTLDHWDYCATQPTLGGEEDEFAVKSAPNLTWGEWFAQSRRTAIIAVIVLLGGVLASWMWWCSAPEERRPTSPVAAADPEARRVR
eukprot:Hpha_TRINITY_DN9106_c0_g1::TRINITY_DN9106_c0_g1_i2::g.94464::m.94464